MPPADTLTSQTLDRLHHSAGHHPVYRLDAVADDARTRRDYLRVADDIISLVEQRADRAMILQRWTSPRLFIRRTQASLHRLPRPLHS